jgi:preprotein translocase subunit SecA
MTGTPRPSAEFFDIYKMTSSPSPTNVPVKRIDEDENSTRTMRTSSPAIDQGVQEKQAIGQPVLVGTGVDREIGAAVRISQSRGRDHAVLNARHHEQEAHIVAQAGRLRAVTIATNMAGARHRHPAGRQC